MLNGIDLEIPPGKITAILGPNGSGKTTILKTILGLVKPSLGMISYLNTPLDNAGNYRRQIGYLPQAAKFPENLRVEELLTMMADIRGQEALYLEDLIGLFELKSYLMEPIKNLSGGTRQKVSTVIAFMFDSEIFILDEPTAGLDPLSLLKLKQLIYDKQQMNQTVLLTTHIIGLVEEIAQHIIFLLEGKIYFEGSVKQLLVNQDQPNLEKAIANILRNENSMRHKCAVSNNLAGPALC